MVIKIIENTEQITLDMDISDVYTYSQVAIAKIIMDFIAQLNDYTDTYEKYPEKIKLKFIEKQEN